MANLTDEAVARQDAYEDAAMCCEEMGWDWWSESPRDFRQAGQQLAERLRRAAREGRPASCRQREAAALQPAPPAESDERRRG